MIIPIAFEKILKANLFRRASLCENFEEMEDKPLESGFTHDDIDAGFERFSRLSEIDYQGWCISKFSTVFSAFIVAKT